MEDINKRKRAEEEKEKLQVQQTHSEKMVGISVLKMEAQLKKQNIRAVGRYERTSKIEINKEEMQQEFLNMVTNAVDTMLSKGGK